MMENKIKIKKDDKVKVIAGKDKGKIGKVIKVERKNNRILLENINIVKRHTKPSGQSRQGGIIESEAPLKISNVMLVCSKCLKPTRVKIKHLDDGKRIRICAKCGEIIDS